MKSILIVEDDENLNQGISLKFTKEGYHVLSAYTLKEAECIWKQQVVDLIICDITMPDGNGLDFGKRIRKESSVVFIYLSALDQEIDFINGYDTGADDYISKPFSVSILVSKVNARMSRMKESHEEILQSEGYEVVLNEMSVRYRGETIHLSKTELRVLICLLKNKKKIVTKEQLLESIWGNEGQFVDESTITVNISRIKNKLGTDAISNVRGLGYIWTGN